MSGGCGGGASTPIVIEPFPPRDIPWSALGRYLAGELLPDERQAIERWIAASPKHAELVDELRQLWTTAPDFRQQWDVEAAIRRVAQPAVEPARIIRLPAFYRETPVSRWRRAGNLALRAAAVVAVLGGGIWVMNRPASSNDAKLTAAPEVRTLGGQRTGLWLPDGSEVKLGPATTMRYAVAPRHGPRTIYLDGEAYFAVVHDAARPFTVYTAHGIVRDLGTRFGVHAYQADSVVEVAVREGKVALAALQHGRSPTAGAGPRQVVLAAHDVGTATAGGRVQAERGADVAMRLAWTDGRLELHAAPLRDAVVQLGRWYGLDIRLGDSLSADRRLNASFERESAAEALQLIAATLTLRIEQRGATVILWSKRLS